MSPALPPLLGTGQMMAAYSSSELIGIYQNLEQSCLRQMGRKQQSYFFTTSSDSH